MWPFASRFSRVNVIAPQPKALPDFKEFLDSSAKLKVWLPQVLVDRVNWLSKHEDASRPDVLRGLIFQHIYGHVAYLSLIDYKKELDRIKRLEAEASQAKGPPRIDTLLHGGPFGDEIIRSPSRSTEVDIAMIGRADEDITIGLPLKLKEDLKTVAEIHRLTPSSYVRKMLVQMLMGEEAHSRWQYEVGKLSPDLEQLERD